MLRSRWIMRTIPMLCLATALRTQWQPYLDGRTSFNAAIGLIVGRL